jgi:hypothetical protein
MYFKIWLFLESIEMQTNNENIYLDGSVWTY